MDNGVRWERLAVGTSADMNPLLVTYPAGATSSIEGRLMRHSGVEYALIISGELTLQLEFSRYTLAAGDSLAFNSSRPHLYLNASAAECRGVWFNYGRHELEHTRPQVAALHQELGLSGPRPPVSAVRCRRHGCLRPDRLSRRRQPVTGWVAALEVVRVLRCERPHRESIPPCAASSSRPKSLSRSRSTECR